MINDGRGCYILKEKLLYFLCKGINWTNWFIAYAFLYVLPMLFKDQYSDGLEGYGYFVLAGNVLFVIFWFKCASTRSRWFYQIWFFLGYIGAEIAMFKSTTKVPFMYIHANIGEKIILTLMCIGLFASKIYTMKYEKGNYKAGAEDRYNNRVKEKKEKAERSVEEPSRSSKNDDKAKRDAISDINRKYKEGCAAIVKANNEVGAFAFSDKTNREIKELRSKLKREAKQRGVKGKVSIY